MPNSLIDIADVNLGGLSDSDYQGGKNSLAKIVGLDIHNEPGIIKVSQDLEADGDSDSVVTERVKVIVPCTDDEVYMFSQESGKIWKRDTGGGAPVYTLEATAAPAAGQADHLDAIEFNGYIYYAMEDRLGRWQVGTAWGSRNDNFGTFTNGSTEFHPMHIKNNVLFIGDGNLVAQVDSAGVFTANALDLDSKFTVTALGEIQNDLLVGTRIANNGHECKIFRWDTYSTSWNSDDTVPEFGITAFIPFDNFVVAYAGVRGNIYSYDGLQLRKIKKVQGSFGLLTGGTAEVRFRAVAYINGLPLFGLSNVSGNPALQGIYAFGGYSDGYPNVLSLQYPIDSTLLDDLTVTAMAVPHDAGAVTGDELLVAWYSGSNQGIYKLRTNKYDTAYLETRVLRPNRIELKEFRVYVPYRSLPEGTSITIKKKVNNGAWETMNSVVDDQRNIIETDAEDVGEAATLQIRVEFGILNNDAPEIEGVQLVF